MRTVGIIFLIVVVAFLLSLLLGWFFMLGWNYVIVPIFGMKVIGYWISVGAVWFINLIAAIFARGRSKK